MPHKNSGLHLTLDMSKCSMEKLKSISLVYDLLKNLPAKIGMQPITLPHCVKWMDKGAAIEGISGIIMLAESHISVHTFPEADYAFADVFSCRSFNADECKKEIIGFFEAKKYHKGLMKRGLDFRD